MDERRSWEEMGAASGVLAVLMFVAAFIAFMTTDPSGAPSYPSIENAQTANDFFSQNVNGMRAQVLFNTLGIALFLWFLGALWKVLREAEGGAVRGSAVTLVAASAGSGLLMVGYALTYSILLTTSPAQADTVPALFTAATVLFTLGGGLFSLFFLAVGKVILETRVMGRWLGWLALVAAVPSVLTFTSPFWVSGVLNPATGALGQWTWWAAFVVWLLLASLVLVFRRRHPVTAERSENVGPVPTVTEGVGK